MVFTSAEKHQSQIPAVQLLVAFGFDSLFQAEVRSLRNVLL